MAKNQWPKSIFSFIFLWTRLISSSVSFFSSLTVSITHTHDSRGAKPATPDLRMHDHRHLSHSPPSSPPTMWCLWLGGDAESGGRAEWWSWACGDEETEKLVVANRVVVMGRRGGNRESSGRETRRWSWGLRQRTEKFLRRRRQKH
ncbi:Uncharacterized protein Rs2_10040 [Raphanus sativus]|nr:Uncharacterized protein Rs2_10040 [Raphanus sativus]